MSITISELIHPTAVVGHEVELDDSVQVGPYAILEGPIRVGPGCVIEGHACLSGPLTMGRDNIVGHGAILGKPPQHRSDRGESCRLTIGDGNAFREHVTVHRGTAAGGGETVIGDNNLMMIGSHLGHDARMGDNCTLVNGALVAGHAVLGDGCVLSGHSAIQQRVRVGRLAMLGGLGSSTKDIPPFILQQGYNTVSGLNVIGLRRAGFSPASINALREAFRVLYKEGRTLSSAVDSIDMELGHIAEIAEFSRFLRESTIGVCPGRKGARQRAV
jgi:UDP-N-acetylglucosamine acyltransferase